MEKICEKMPINNCKKTKQIAVLLKFNKKRVAAKKRLYKKIQEDYIKMRLKNLDKGYIIKTLQEKYKNYEGMPCSHMTIYNALNFNEINKRIRATQACDPLLIAQAEQGTLRCSAVLFFMNVQKSLTHSDINA
jgi:hypothetical protein